jgi:adenosyl cobinamide kinase/adenosyl cobinamide phosphate guanylyltransferase
LTTRFCQRSVFRIFLIPASAHFGKLLFSQAQLALVLLFHQFDRMRNIRLPMRRPAQHAIKDFFHLLFCHGAIITDWPRNDHRQQRRKINSVSDLSFVLGGARSGKSRYAERLITALPPPWVYIATAEALDTEMTERIAAHRARRGANWRTVDAPHDVVAALSACGASPVLVDCLTLWLSNIMLSDADVEDETARFETALAAKASPVVLVANEVGLGIVPEHPLGRGFRDLQGVLNQRIAARADRVILMVAGLPLALKGNLP